MSSQVDLSSTISTFDCPICIEILQPPIYLCTSGHSICKSCKEKVVNCPTCRQPILPMRNFYLEGIVDQSSVMVDCKFCIKKFKMDQLEDHQKSCENRAISINCVINVCDEKNINLKEYYKHLITAHGFKLMSPPFNINFSLNWVEQSIVGENGIRLIQMLQFKGLHFVQHYVYRDGLLYIWIECIEEDDENILDKFFASISIYKNDPEKEGVKFHCKVYSIQRKASLESKILSVINISALEHQLDLGPERIYKILINIQEKNNH